MIQSMTGYGKEVVQLPSKTITIEIKSLNSKGLDLNTRVPSSYRDKDLEIRDLLAKSLERGKIDFSLNIEVSGTETSVQLNRSEERRVGKECRSGRSTEHEKKKKSEIEMI